MKILICGGSGQVGTDCAKVLGNIHDLVSYDKLHLDITDPVVVGNTIRTQHPDIVLNCAAYTRVDDCETDRELSWKVNAEGPGNLARAVRRSGARLIHISTDYVYDGRREPPEPYVEDDETAPLSHYGKTKLGGEQAIREATDNHIIVRTAWIYGLKGHNFLKTLLKLSMKHPGRVFKIVDDQYGSPTWSHRLAEQISRLIEQDSQGTYHATAEGYCTWYQLARYFLEKMGLEHNLVPCSTEEYPTPAIRPRNSILENRRLKGEGINIMSQWRDDIDLFVKEFRTSLISECKMTAQD
jgi:dTDP-4-dehydrorhamnose reductase